MTSGIGRVLKYRKLRRGTRRLLRAAWQCFASIYFKHTDAWDSNCHSYQSTILYCSSSLPNVRVNVIGTVTGSQLSDGSGNYTFRFLPWAGNYTVTPAKAALAPGANNINTVDVIAVQRHFLGIALLPPGCRLAAADVNEDSAINTLDVIAIQRFALGFTSGIANTGQYQFTPASRNYPGPAPTGPSLGNYEHAAFQVSSSFAE